MPAAALRGQGLVVMEPLPVDIAAVLPATVGMHEELGGQLRQKRALQGGGDQFFGHGGGYVPAHEVLAVHVLEGAQLGLGTSGER